MQLKSAVCEAPWGQKPMLVKTVPKNRPYIKLLIESPEAVLLHIVIIIEALFVMQKNQSIISINLGI